MLQQLFNKVTNAFAMSEPAGARASSARNHSFSTNNTSSVLGESRRSRSIGNITEPHYDTVFSTNSFVIATGRASPLLANNNSISFSSDDYDSNHSVTEKLLK